MKPSLLPIDVLPLKGQRLADPHPGVHENMDQRGEAFIDERIVADRVIDTIKNPHQNVWLERSGFRSPRSRSLDI